VTEFKVPELGENVASGDVAKVLVSVGDTVKMEQPVIELETDKATIEVPSSVAGVVSMGKFTHRCVKLTFSARPGRGSPLWPSRCSVVLAAERRR
jgi:hypothetical protein